MKRLDRTRPFGTVCGDTEGRRFEQDGIFFDAAGHAMGTPKATKASQPAPAPSVDPAVDAQLEAQLKG